MQIASSTLSSLYKAATLRGFKLVLISLLTSITTLVKRRSLFSSVLSTTWTSKHKILATWKHLLTRSANDWTISQVITVFTPLPLAHWYVLHCCAHLFLTRGSGLFINCSQSFGIPHFDIQGFWLYHYDHPFLPCLSPQHSWKRMIHLTTLDPRSTLSIAVLLEGLSFITFGRSYSISPLKQRR